MGLDPHGETSTETPPRAASPRLLLVDDSRLVRRTVGGLLEAEGFSVDTASSGEQAFARCLSEPFDLVVSDVTMGALSGMQLCWLLRNDETTAHLPVVLLTAETDPGSRFWARHAGADAYVAKKDMRSMLVPTVARELEARERVPSSERSAPTGSPDPLPRLAQILEHNLFRAVVAGEVRELIRHVEDRAAFVRGLLAVTADVASYEYLTLRLDGPITTTLAVHARGPFPAEPTDRALAALGLEATPAMEMEVVQQDATRSNDVVPEPGPMACFAVCAADETLGELSVFPGEGRRLSDEDQRTLSLIATELGVLAKSLFLVQETRRLADTDPLTGLANRRVGTERLTHEIDRAARTGRPFCVALCDLDHFKRVNDEHGHAVGDQVLRVTAQELERRTRSVDMVSRWGGEELLVLLTDADATGGRIVGKRLRIAVARASRGVLGDGITMSVGVAAYEPGIGVDALVERADRALYRAKEQGRDALVVYGED